ncbi:hypothetical protein CHLRE_08g360444v5 [Chlamydomonas reinhardtii]|uniref:Uncharacterized protein n=1 Tax=Chlamydomonas reinhardtii TaxID=3055 RepID=A0A2K3DGH2_CHLRE|nr:uncharacterized protein CHLRE_08g360444v5 [Chlamydomonas reinhardtii]PNW79622.1 hypothetical protein CHLRE_08g360444v5 [Chlamydomonas reinhardtii]
MDLYKTGRLHAATHAAGAPATSTLQKTWHLRGRRVSPFSPHLDEDLETPPGRWLIKAHESLRSDVCKVKASQERKGQVPFGSGRGSTH